jgi:hypothetical protein
LREYISKNTHLYRHASNSYSVSKDPLISRKPRYIYACVFLLQKYEIENELFLHFVYLLCVYFIIVGEEVSISDIGIVTLNGMLHKYQVFITSLTTRVKSPSHDELAGIFMREEGMRKCIDFDG